MSVSSDVQICSNALLLLGANPISDFGEDGAGATLSANLWPTVRDAVLRAHPWNVASYSVVLAPESTAFDFDWSYSFLLPAENLRVLSVGRDGTTPDYRVRAGRVLLDDAVCYLRYIKQLTDVTKYDSLLALAMTAGMAANLAYPITKSQAQQDAMVKLYQFHLRQARTIDGLEDPTEDMGDNPLITVRV